MRFSLLAGFLVLGCPSLAIGQTSEETVVLARILGTLCLDIVEELNGCETAVLLSSDTEPDTADLLIFADRRSADGPVMLETVRSIAYSGPFFGQSPSLERADNGSLLLHSEQVGVGRSPWTQTLTIAHRGGDFVVAGHSYSTYDRATGGSFACDVNLLTGDWVATAERPNPETEEIVYTADQSGRIAAARPPVSAWTWTTDLPPPCAEGLNQWFDAAP